MNCLMMISLVLSLGRIPNEAKLFIVYTMLHKLHRLLLSRLYFFSNSGLSLQLAGFYPARLSNLSIGNLGMTADLFEVL